MFHWRILWIGILVLSLISPSSLNIAVGDFTHPQQLTTPPYQDWFDNIGQVPETYEAVIPFNGYIYASGNGKIAVLDQSNVNYLHHVGESIPLNQTPIVLAAIGNYLYAASLQGTLFVFNLDNPRAPVLVNSISVAPYSSHLLAGAAGLVFAAGNYIRLYSLTDPATPVVYKTYDTGLPIKDLILDGLNLYYSIVNNYIDSSIYRIDLTNLSTPANVYTVAGDFYHFNVRGSIGVATQHDDTLILDFSAPANPQLIGKIHQFGHSAGEIFISGHYAYIFYEGSISVIDCTNLVQPRLLSNRQYLGEKTGDDLLLIEEGDRLYVVDPGFGISALDISQPTRPALLADWGNPTYTALEYDGIYLFAATNRGRLKIYDVSGPGKPVLRGELSTAGIIDHIQVKDGLAILLGKFNIYFSLLIVDVHDPGNPVILSDFSPPPQIGPVKSFSWNGPYVYATSGSSVVTIDLSNPRLPKIINSFSPSWAIYNLAVQGNWLYFVDAITGLNIYSLANPAAPALLTTYDVDFGATYNGPLSVALYSHYALVHSGIYLAVVDVQNPATPVQVGVVTYVPSKDGKMIVAGDQVFMGGSGSIYSVQLTDPFNLTVIKRQDLSDAPNFSGIAAGNMLFLATRNLIRLESLPSVVKTFDGGANNQTIIVDSPQDSVTYSFAPYSFYSAGFFIHTILPDVQAPSIPPNLRGIISPFKNTLVEFYNPSYSFSMSYTNTQVAGLTEDSLALYFWNGQNWIKDPTSSVNTAANTLTAEPIQQGIWMVAGSSSSVFNHKVMLPILMRSQPLDLNLTGIEITQGVQKTGNSLPLVQNRPTVLRAFMQTSQSGGTRNVYLSISASRNGQPLPGSPLTSGPWTMQTYSTRAIHESAAYSHLPPDWLSGDVTFTVRLDPDNHFSEVNENNNTISYTSTFHSVPPLHVVIVPINYTHIPTGQVFPPVTHDSISWSNMDVFPVPGLIVEMHAPINFSGSLPGTGSWTSLLNLVTSLKNSEGRPQEIIYYGVVEAPGAVDFGIVGTGWLGQRASVGVNTFDTMAHELGHNFGLNHSWIRPPYPYTLDRLGELGFSTITHAVYPGDFFADLMSYNSNPVWISDYHYTGVYNGQLTYEAATPSAMPKGGVLLLSGSMSAEGSVDMLPVYTLPDIQPYIAQEGQLKVVLLGADGRELARYPLALFSLPEEGDGSQRFDAALPLPKIPVSVVQIYQGDALLAERRMESGQSATLPSHLMAGESGSELAWQSAGKPVMVRASSDAGKSWQVVAINISGSRYQLNPEWFPASSVRFQIIPADRGSLDWNNNQYTEVDLNR